MTGYHYWLEGYDHSYHIPKCKTSKTQKFTVGHQKELYQIEGYNEPRVQFCLYCLRFFPLFSFDGANKSLKIVNWTRLTWYWLTIDMFVNLLEYILECVCYVYSNVWIHIKCKCPIFRLKNALILNRKGDRCCI